MYSKSKRSKNYPSDKFEETSNLECIKNYLSAEFKKTRIELGLTQEQMAEKLAISTRAYADIERKKSCCSLDTLAMFLKCCCRKRQAFFENFLKALDQKKNNCADTYQHSSSFSYHSADLFPFLLLGFPDFHFITFAARRQTG